MEHVVVVPSGSKSNKASLYHIFRLFTKVYCLILEHGRRESGREDGTLEGCTLEDQRRQGKVVRAGQGRRDRGGRGQRQKQQWRKQRRGGR